MEPDSPEPSWEHCSHSIPDRQLSPFGGSLQQYFPIPDSYQSLFEIAVFVVVKGDNRRSTRKLGVVVLIHATHDQELAKSGFEFANALTVVLQSFGRAAMWSPRSAKRA